MSNLCLWCFTGPWFLGELLEGHTGVVFVWGMFVYGSYLPLCLTYVYGVSLSSPKNQGPVKHHKHKLDTVASSTYTNIPHTNTTPV